MGNTVVVSQADTDIIAIQKNQTVVIEEVLYEVVEILQNTVIEITAPGPQGPQGPVGPGGGGTLTVIAGENISQYQVVRILSDGQGYLADRNDATHGVFVAGVATNSALTGEPVTVRTDGLMSTAPMWTLGPLFVGDAGALISTPPPGTMTDYQLQVAVAVTTSELLVRPQITIFSIQP